MKTTMINNKRINVRFERDDQIDQMSTAVYYRSRRLEAVSVYVYTPVTPRTLGIPGYRVLVLSSNRASELQGSTTPITESKYWELLDMPPGRRHTAMIELCGGENLLKLA